MSNIAKKHYTKRVISLLMVMLLTVCMLPTNVFAEEENADTVKNGYYQDRQWVEGTLTQVLPDGIQSVNKTAQKIGTNTYQITLKVVAEQRSTTTSPGAAATVLLIDVSGSMASCAECGLHWYGSDFNGYYVHAANCSHYNYQNNAVTNEQTRLTATKNAATAFLASYRGNAVSDRLINIVTFSNNASSSSWYDVAAEDGYNSALLAVNRISAGGNTNMYAGLGTANTVLSQSAVQSIPDDAKNVVVLSDGAPNRASSNAMTMTDVVSQTTSRATTLKENASVYTVCFGAASDTIYNGGPTVGDFLRNNVASDSSKAFNADNTDELNAAFEAIAESITSGSDGSGLPVTDGEAPFVTATVDGQEYTEGFTWNLDNPEVSTRTENGTSITTYTYTKIYTVTLDADQEDFVEGQWYPLNGETYLTMEDGTRVDFPVPAGQGTKSRYTVRWVNEDGTELETDENVTYGSMPTYDSKEPTKAATDEYTYTFTGWSPEISPVTGDITYTAQYSAAKNSYTVRWVDEDGTELEIDENVEYGTMPSYDSTEPSKEATDEYTYTFSGWTPTVSPVTGNITYTAQYEGTRNSYTVRWVDEDGTELEIDENVEYGTMPSYDSTEPSKEATDEYTYTFTGWTPTVSPVTGNITYTAQYDGTRNSYTVRWVDEDGTELEIDENVEYGTMPSYDSTEPSKAVTDEYTYTFTGWTPTVSPVTGNITYTARYNSDVNSYTVRWVDEDGTELEVDENVEYGTMPSYDSDIPSKEATDEYTYTFAGWNPTVNVVTGNITYTAQYEGTRNSYTVRWVDEDGTELEIDENVEYGTMPSYDSTEPSKETTDEYTYTFTGWNPTVSPVTGNITYTAQYEAVRNLYTVTWADEDGTELEVDENVEYGTMPSYDSNEPSKAVTDEFTYIFAGWNPEVSVVTGNITYTAQYEVVRNSYTVRWVDEDGTELETDENVAYGDMPSYDSEEPTKENTDEFTYIFTGWNPEVSAVTGDITYTAQYEGTRNSYTVRWVDEDGTELEIDEHVPYGQIPTYDGHTPTKKADDDYTYTFKGWQPIITPVTGDMTYTAEYNATKKSSDPEEEETEDPENKNTNNNSNKNNNNNTNTNTVKGSSTSSGIRSSSGISSSSGTSSSTGTSSKTSTSPKTGDESNLILWMILLCISSGTVIALRFARRKE